MGAEPSPSAPAPSAPPVDRDYPPAGQPQYPPPNNAYPPLQPMQQQQYPQPQQYPPQQYPPQQYPPAGAPAVGVPVQLSHALPQVVQGVRPDPSYPRQEVRRLPKCGGCGQHNGFQGPRAGAQFRCWSCNGVTVLPANYRVAPASDDECVVL